MKGAEERGAVLAETGSFESVTGKGVKGRVEGRTVALGNRALLEALGVSAGDLVARAEELRADGQTVMFVAVDGKPAGLLGVADQRAPAAEGRCVTAGGLAGAPGAATARAVVVAASRRSHGSAVR